LSDNTLHARQSPYFKGTIEGLIRLYDASDEGTSSGSFGDGFHAIAHLLSGPDNATGQPAVSSRLEGATYILMQHAEGR
jgi:hypothetical protein